MVSFFEKVNTKAVWVGFIASILIAVYLTNPMGMAAAVIPNYVQPKKYLKFMISFLIIGGSVIVSVLASFVTGNT